jgi:hypothetical protein
MIHVNSDRTQAAKSRKDMDKPSKTLVAVGYEYRNEKDVTLLASLLTTTPLELIKSTQHMTQLSLTHHT